MIWFKIAGVLWIGLTLGWFGYMGYLASINTRLAGSALVLMGVLLGSMIWAIIKFTDPRVIGMLFQ